MIKRLLALLCAVLFVLPAIAADDDIVRLYTFSPGTTIQSSRMNAEFNQIISTMNGKVSRGGVNTLSGNNTHSGNNIFSGTNSFSGTNTFSTGLNVTGQANFARGTDPGSPANGDLWFNSATGIYKFRFGAVTYPILGDFGIGVPNFTSDPASLTDGNLWYNSTSDVLKLRANGSTVILGGASSAYPYAYQGTAAPVYTGTNTFTVAYIACRDSTDTYNLNKTTSTTVDISTTGAGGRDAGSDSSSTWYYLYVIGKTDGTTSLILSTVNERVSGSITQPSGYTLKRQLPFAVRNDGSANFIKWMVSYGWPSRPLVLLEGEQSYYNGGNVAGTTSNVLSNGSATSQTAVSLANYVPAISQQAMLNGYVGSNTGSYSLRPTGTSWAANTIISSWVNPANSQVLINTNSSQSIDYIRNAGTGALWLDVIGFIVTEVP